ncbi:MAG: putative metal-binding motif-containing protein [Pseudomonadota bacterium]
MRSHLHLLALALIACDSDDSKPADDTGCADADADGYCAYEDCDDADDGVNPGVDEESMGPDEQDNDCDGVVDECSESDPSVTWHSAEVCDGVDNDCDGLVDEDLAGTWYPDADGDGWGDDAGATERCEGGSGWVTEPGDCDDGDAGVHPGALERCDGVDDDCDPETGEDGTVSLDDGQAFTTIQAALDAAPADSEVAVCAGTWVENLTVARSLRLWAPAGPEATTLVAAGEGSVVTVTGGDVVIEGFTVTGGTGGLVAEGETDLCGGGILAFAADSLLVDGCVVTANQADYGGGLLGPGEGTLTLRRSIFSGNEASRTGGGLYLYAGDLTDVTIADNAAAASGGGLYAYQHEVSMEGCTLSGNSAVYGGGMRMYQATVRAEDTVLEGNSASYGGGAYTVDDATLEGPTLRANEADRGGGLYARQDLTLTHVTLEGNSASSYGGGLACVESALVATRVTARANSAYGGAGMLLDTCVLTADTVEVTGGQADYGAGLYMVEAEIEATGDLRIAENTADGAGGGAYIYSASAWSGGTLEANTAGTGAGVFVQDTSVLEDLVVQGNTATDWGGGLYTEAETDLSGLLIDGNSATYGAGLYLYGTADVWLDGGQLTANVANTRGGGVRVAAGLLQITAADLGEEATDNSPDDLFAGGTAYTGYGAGTTLSCSGSEGCH